MFSEVKQTPCGNSRTKQFQSEFGVCAGPVSIYMQRGTDKEALEFRPGLFPLLISGAGAIFIANLPEQDTRDVIARELEELDSKRSRQEALSSVRDAVSPKGYARMDH